MSESISLVDALARVRDCLYAAAENLDKYVQAQTKIHTEEPDMSKIQWTKADGEHGPYEKTDDVNNAEYKKLRQALKDHKEKMQFQGFFLWVFQNGATIGRKKAVR